MILLWQSWKQSLANVTIPNATYQASDYDTSNITAGQLKIDNKRHARSQTIKTTKRHNGKDSK
jgi:hypothetical protein